MKGKDRVLIVLKYMTLIAGAFVALAPIIVVFFASFKTPEEFASTGALVPPENWINVHNYIKAFVEGQMLKGFLNTVIILVVSMCGAIIFSTMTSYVLHRFAFKARKVVMGLFLIATLIPAITTQVATFQIVTGLGLFNSRMAAIVLYMGTDIISVYIFLQFLDSIPVSLDEAALLEGASYLTIYRKIILPMLKPAISTVMVVKGVQIYNDFYTPFLYMPKPDLFVISTALFKFKGPYGTQWEVISAGIILAIIPTMVVFLVLQKYIYNGFAQGSVK